MKTVWAPEVDQILSSGRWLGHVGVRNWLLSRAESFIAIDGLAAIGIGILGGDVYGGGNVPITVSRDGWHCDPEDDEDFTDFVSRSAAKAREYISFYTSDCSEVGFVLIPRIYSMAR